MNGLISIGHGRQKSETFISLLSQHKVSVVVDVRTFTNLPSRPDFAPTALARALAADNIRYRRIEVLSGLREREPERGMHGTHRSLLRGYERHMRSAPFQAGLEAVTRQAVTDRVAIMCAEQHPVRCHVVLLEQELSD